MLCLKIFKILHGFFILQYGRSIIPTNISCFPRRLEDVLKMPSAQQSLIFQDVFKRSSRGVGKMCLQNVFKTSSKISSRRVFKTSSRCCQDVFKKTTCKHVFKRSWKTKNVTLKTSARNLYDIFSTSSPRQLFAGINWFDFFKDFILFLTFSLTLFTHKSIAVSSSLSFSLILPPNFSIAQ